MMADHIFRLCTKEIIAVKAKDFRALILPHVTEIKKGNLHFKPFW